MQAILIPWTVWELRSLDGRQVVRRADRSYPGDGRHQHEYQRVVARVEAFTREEALRKAENIR